MNEASAARPAKKTSYLRWLGTVFSIILMVYLLIQEKDEILDALRQIALWRFLVAFLLMMISRLAVTGRWHVLLRGAEVKITLGQSTRITFAGLFAANFLPTTIGGDVLRLASAIRLGYDQAVSLASLIVDRLVGMFGMGMVAVTLPISLLLTGYYSTASLPLKSYMPLFSLAFSWQTWLSKIIDKARSGMSRLFQALAIWWRKPRYLLWSLVFTWIHMLCLFIQIKVLLDGMDEPVSFWLIAGLWSVTYFVTLLPVSINGMGVQELATVFFYTGLGGITNPTALILALLLRVLQMLASLPGALFIPGILAGERGKVA